MRKFATRKLGIGIALAILGLVGTQETRAQGAHQVGTFYGDGGTVAVAVFKVPVTQNPCAYFHQTGMGGAECAAWALVMQPFLTPPAPLDRTEARRAAQASDSSTPTLTLSSSTPGLPFLGNRLVVLSYVLNSTVVADATAAYEAGLRRQADCSLDEDLLLPGASPPSAEVITSFTGAQDYFHQLSGLTTTPDVFANGCGYQALGLPSTNNVLLLGNTSAGGVISAELTSNGLIASVTNLAANTVTNTTLSSSATAGNFLAADLRGIGTMDIVEAIFNPTTAQSSMAVFLGNGDGTFKPAVNYNVGGSFTVDDVTGDGIPDIVVLNATSPAADGENGTVTTLIGKGDGTFTIGPVSNVTWTGTSAAATGDFNGDGKNDLLVGGTVLFGGGDGTFTQGPTTTALASLIDSVGVNAVGDLNKDGKLDVAVSQPGSVSIFYGNGDGTFQTGPTYAALPDYEQLTITDIDGDGNPDIVVGTSTGGIYTDGGYDVAPPLFQILMGRGDGTFVDSLAYNHAALGVTGTLAQEMASADFNGDGKPDVLLVGQSNGGNTTNSLVMAPGDGKGNLGTGLTSSVNISPTIVVAADMNGDGKPDAVLAGASFVGGNPSVSVLINQGNGTFAGEQDYTVPNTVVSLAVGDFNGDGLMDVAVGVSGETVAGETPSGPSGVYVLLGQANGTLGAPVQIDTSLNPSGLAAASLTGDGRTDLVVADQGVYAGAGSSEQVNGALHVYLGNADGTFTTKTAPTTTATNYSVAALGDLNNDGKPDLIVAGNVAGTSGGTLNVYTLLGNGDGTFQAVNTLPTAPSDGEGIGATSIALADFNKDGNLDVALGNPNGFSEVLLGNGDGTLTDTILALGQRPGIIAAADLLGNGFPELLALQPGASGGDTLAVFLNTTTAWTAPSYTSGTLATTTTALTASATSVTSGTSVTFTATITPAAGSTATPTGTVTFMDGTTSLGAGSVSSGVATYSTTALATGSNSITAVYGGDSNFSGSTSAAVTVTVTTAPVAAATTTTLTASATTITVGANVTFTATVTGASGSTGTPGGTVTFMDGTATLGTETLSASGVATYATTALPTGSDSITAIYGGSTSFSGSTSAAVTVTVTAVVVNPSFALGSSGNITVNPGATTGNTSTISTAGSNGFSGAVSLSCTVSPTAASDPATCSLSPTSVTISGATAQTSTLTITTTAATSAALSLPGHPRAGGVPVPWYAAGGGTLACVLLFGIPARRRGWRAMLGMLILLAFLTGGLSSCSGGGSSGGGGTGNSGTTAGTYTVTVTGTSGSTTETTAVTLTVN